MFGFGNSYFNSYRDMKMLFHSPDGAGGWRAKLNQKKRRKRQRRAGNGRMRKK